MVSPTPPILDSPQWAYVIITQGVIIFHMHVLFSHASCCGNSSMQNYNTPGISKVENQQLLQFCIFLNVKLQHALCAKVLSLYFCNTQHVLQTCHGANATQGMCSVCCVLTPGSGVRLLAVGGRVSGSISGCRVVLVQTVAVWRVRSRFSQPGADLPQTLTA